MPDSLPELEGERSQILRRFTTLGDLRQGSICAVLAAAASPPATGEMLTRSAMHRAGAAGLRQLLQFPAPPVEQRTAPWSCGHEDYWEGRRVA